MKITTQYLKERHQYWLNKIDEFGIWDKSKFLSVDIVVRYNCKSFAGLFHRKYLKENSRFNNATTGINGYFYDRLIIYQNRPDYTVKEIDDTLVHEMIHQYIIQGNIRDTSSHGRIFIQLMDKINCYFFGDLDITIKDTSKVEIKEGINTHKILIIGIDSLFYACKIKYSKIYEFNEYVLKNKSRLKINFIDWYETKNTYFDNFRECTSKLHGIKKPMNQLQDFCDKYNIYKKPIVEQLI